MSHEQKHAVPLADATRLAGDAYRTQIRADCTRVAGAGYRSILATRVGAPLTAEQTERYKIGDRISGRYEVLAIHRGSMGVVYGTFDHKEKLPRALKTLQERFALNANMRDLFAEEAATWVRLGKHPFIVRAYFVEKFDGRPYVVTGYVRGEVGMGGDLQAWLGHPRLTLKLAVEMALQIAQGMQHAVQAIPGLVHRDLKPANILVDSRARAMLTDFGLVCAAETEAGTPAYMAPEQWRGESLDARSDIYSYGCILYEMFTGHRMFAAETVDQWKYAHLNQTPVALRILQMGVPEEIETIVMSCLAKVSEERPQNWDEVVSTLASLFHSLTGQAAALDFSVFELDAGELLAASYSLGRLKKYEEMLSVCNRALEADPTSNLAWLNKGAALDWLGRCAEAISCYDHALALNSANAATWNNKGNSLNKLTLHEEAILCFDRALVLAPDDADAWNNKGCALHDLGRYDEAILHYDRALEANPNRADSCHNKGKSLLGISRYEEAITYYDRALSLEPYDAGTWNDKGCALQDHGFSDEAIRHYDRALELNPVSSICCCNKGNALNSLKRFDEAIVYYDRALAIKPGFPEAWFGRGNSFRELKRYERAIACYDQVLAISPNDADAWNNKGYALQDLGRYDEAFVHYDKALKIDPNRAETCYNRGILLNILKRYNEAVLYYDRALAVRPNDAGTWNNKGNSLQHLQRYEEAIGCYDCALKIDPRYVLARSNRGVAIQSFDQQKASPVSRFLRFLGR